MSNGSGTRLVSQSSTGSAAVDIDDTEVQPGPFRSALVPGTPALLGAFAVFGGWKMGLGSLLAPGPGLWPFIVGAALVITASGIAVFDRNELVEKFDSSSINVLAGLLLLTGFVWLFSRIGLVVATTAVLTFWLHRLGKESWVTSILVALGTGACLQWLFGGLLGVPLPAMPGFQ